MHDESASQFIVFLSVVFAKLLYPFFYPRIILTLLALHDYFKILLASSYLISLTSN